VKLLRGQKMTDLTDTSLEALLRKMIDEAPKTGAIPSKMLSTYVNDPRMPVFAKPDYEIEVDFND
jgi:hypothetical protein